MPSPTRSQVRDLLFNAPFGTLTDDNVVTATVGDVVDAVLALLAEAPAAPVELGRKVIRLREARCWTTFDLADRAHLSESMVRCVEDGTRTGSRDVLAAVAGAFGLGLLDLLAGTEWDIQVVAVPTDPAAARALAEAPQPRVLWSASTYESDGEWFAKPGKSYVCHIEVDVPPGTRVQVIEVPG